MAERKIATVTPDDHSAYGIKDMAADPRLVHLESRVSHLESDVKDIKEGVKQLLSRPTNPGLTQTLQASLTILATASIILGFAEWRLTQATAPLIRDMTTLQANTQAADAAIEKSVVDVRIRAAVLEERSVWMRSQGSWKAEVK